MQAVQLENRMPAWLGKEWVIHLFLWIGYFVVIAYAKDEPGINFWEYVFTINYFIGVLVINYVLLPRFFYRKKYLTFVLLSLLVLVLAVVIEEFVLEQLFFPDTNRSKNFYGFLPNILQIGPTILFFVGFKLAWDNREKQSDLERLEKENNESQLQFLKSQLNPHFLFNNLNNLYSYSQEGSAKTPEIILQLSAIMRYMLYESRENFVPLQKEINYLKDYIRLQELQMEERGKLSFDVEGETSNQEIAPLILIAFVENSFKHSLASQSDQIKIDIKLKVHNGQLDFYCSNTFQKTVGSAEEYVASGIGLENVKKRLALLYPDRHELRIQPTADLYSVHLTLQL